MKSVSPFLFLTYLLLFGGVFSTSVQADGALVTSQSGSVSISLPGGEYASSESNQELPVGTLIETGPNSSCVLLFRNGTTLLLRANTRVLIRKANVFPFTFAEAEEAFYRGDEPSTSNIQLEMAYGNVVATVRKLKPESTFVVVTPQGRTFGNNAVFSTDSESSGERLTLANVSGNVWHESSASSETRVNEGIKVVIKRSASIEKDYVPTSNMDVFPLQFDEAEQIIANSRLAESSVYASNLPVDIKIIFNLTEGDATPSGSEPTNGPEANEETTASTSNSGSGTSNGTTNTSGGGTSTNSSSNQGPANPGPRAPIPLSTEPTPIDNTVLVSPT